MFQTTNQVYIYIIHDMSDLFKMHILIKWYQMYGLQKYEILRRLPAVAHGLMEVNSMTNQKPPYDTVKPYFWVNYIYI